MKILGVSFGKVMGNTDILVKEALFGAKVACPEAEIEFINTVNLTIDRCIGCGMCSKNFDKGLDNDCILKDDFTVLEEKIRDADCLIVGAPVYVLQPVGQYKNFVDRFSTRHDVGAIAYQIEKRKNGLVNGPTEIDPRRTKQRYIGYISVGGATTPHWVSMGTAGLHLLGFPNLMKVIGNLNVHHMGTTGSPVLNKELMATVNELGSRVAKAYDQPMEQIEWFGEEGTCPVCHQNLMTMTGTTAVVCPICGIEGKLTVDGEKVSVTFTEEEKGKARGTFWGQDDHVREIQGFGAIAAPKIMAVKELLPGMLEKYKKFEEFINC